VGTANYLSEEESNDLSEPTLRANNSKHSKQKTSTLKRWLIDNLNHPYLKASDKTYLAQTSGLTKKQV